jgi:hypothetical protein
LRTSGVFRQEFTFISPYVPYAQKPDDKCAKICNLFLKKECGKLSKVRYAICIGVKVVYIPKGDDVNVCYWKVV